MGERNNHTGVRSGFVNISLKKKMAKLDGWKPIY